MHDMNAERYAELYQAVIQFARHLSEIGHYDTQHPWYGYYPSGMMFGDDATVGSILKDMNKMADSMQACICTAEGHLKNVDFKSHDNIKKLYQLITYEFPPVSGSEVFALLPDIALPGSVMIVNRLEDNLKRVREYELLFKDNITSKQSVSDDELEKARLMLGYAKTIKQQTTPYDQIISRCQALSDISTKLNDAVSAFSLIANSVGIAWDKTLQGALPIAAATKVASAAPLEILAMRDLTLMEPAAIGAIREAKEKASELITMRDTVNEQFEMSVLPAIEDISKAARVFKSGGGLFRIFKKEWRDAKKLYTGISRNAKSIKAAKCAEDLLFLINYLNHRNAFDNANYSTSIGAGFKGIDTEFSRLEQLIQWYEMARAEFIASSSTDMTLQCREILSLSSDRLQWMASKGQEVTDLLSFFDNTVNSVRQVFGGSDIPDGLQNYRNLEGLCAELKLISDMMNQIGAFFSARFHVSVSPAHALTVLESAHDINTVKTSIENDREARALLGNVFMGVETDLKNVFATIEWASMVSSIGLPSDIRKWLLTPEAPERLEIIRSLVCDLYGCWLKIEEHTSELGKFGELNPAQWYSSDVVTPDLISKRSAIALDSMNSLVQWADFSRAFLQMNRYCLGHFSSAALSGSVPASELHTYFNYCFYYSLAKHIMQQNPDLLLFSGIAQSQIRERFIELDEKVIKLNGQKCASTISWRDVPPGNSRGPVKTYTGKALILHELGKKSRHVPIRQLIRRAGKALQALKPCFMMGPLSVSQYLVPGELEFDMIIMDEASQLKPEDALGAVARGKQIVIVGDPKQLPPTSFFDSLINDTPTDEEDVQAAIDGAESILDISQFLFQPIRRLRWHYRSQHESLIAFSNRHFYDDHLVLFPSPHGPKSALGLRYNYVKNAVYVNRSNRLEAARVADAVIQHFQQNPHESLGVVTLNITQRDIIEEEIDRRLKQCEESMSYMAKWDEESYPFFIKNLENVQGDERDVIFISTTFGKGPEGVLRMNFGPITREMGWRRLNVLFTRAKKRVEVFINLASK